MFSRGDFSWGDCSDSHNSSCISHCYYSSCADYSVVEKTEKQTNSYYKVHITLLYNCNKPDTGMVAY